MSWQLAAAILSSLSDIIEILVGGLALVVALTQRKKISNAFAALITYSLRASLLDLNNWLEKLHETSINGSDEGKKVRNVLAYISGKVRGNPTLQSHLGEKVSRQIKTMIDDLESGKTVNESTRIALCSEIKERLATLDIENESGNIKKKYEQR